MSKNTEFSQALAYLKNRVKVATVDSVMMVLKNQDVSLSDEAKRLLEQEINASVEYNVNDSHVAFRTLLD